MNLQAADITGFGYQVGGYVRAFYRGGNDVDDIVIDYALQGVRTALPAVPHALCNLDLFGGEAVVQVLKTRPRVFINGFIIRNSHCILAQQFLGIP